MTPELEALTQRLEAAEKEIARLVAIIEDQSPRYPKILAQSFVVVDRQGVRRAELSVVGESGERPSPWLGLFDANENVRACIGVGGEGADGPIEGPWVELYNEKNDPVVEIRTDKTETAILLRDPNGKARMALGVDSGGSIVTLLGENGEPCMGISADANGPEMRMRDANGETKLQVTSGGICLRNANGNFGLTLMVFPSGEPALTIHDANGEPRLKLALETEGPRLVMSDKDGNANANLVVHQGKPCLVFGKDDKVIWSAPRNLPQSRSCARIARVREEGYL